MFVSIVRGLSAFHVLITHVCRMQNGLILRRGVAGKYSDADVKKFTTVWRNWGLDGARALEKFRDTW